MNAIREKRKLVFGRKRIPPVVVRNLASIIEKESSAFKEQHGQGCFLAFSIDANDDSSYESQSIDIFNEHGIIEMKVLRRVNMRFNTFDFSKNIEVQIVHSIADENKENFILVGGEDSNWVNGIISRLNEAIEISYPQPNVTRIYVVLAWIAVAVLNYLYFDLFGQYIKILSKYGTLGSLAAVTLLLGIPLASVHILQKISDLIEKLFPDVELQTGPQHFRLENVKRNKIMQVFLIIIVPILLAASYDLAKSYLIISKPAPTAKNIENHK